MTLKLICRIGCNCSGVLMACTDEQLSDCTGSHTAHVDLPIPPLATFDRFCQLVRFRSGTFILYFVIIRRVREKGTDSTLGITSTNSCCNFLQGIS